MTLQKKLIISFCSLLIVLNLVNCIFFDGSKIGCTLNISAMVFTIIGVAQNKNSENN
jgi:hypothetical protein